MDPEDVLEAVKKQFTCIKCSEIAKECYRFVTCKHLYCGECYNGNHSSLFNCPLCHVSLTRREGMRDIITENCSNLFRELLDLKAAWPPLTLDASTKKEKHLKTKFWAANHKKLAPKDKDRKTDHCTKESSVSTALPSSTKGNRNARKSYASSIVNSIAGVGTEQSSAEHNNKERKSRKRTRSVSFSEVVNENVSNENGGSCELSTSSKRPISSYSDKSRKRSTSVPVSELATENMSSENGGACEFSTSSKRQNSSCSGGISKIPNNSDVETPKKRITHSKNVSNVLSKCGSIGNSPNSSFVGTSPSSVQSNRASRLQDTQHSPVLSLTWKNVKGETMLHKACAKNNIENIRKLLEMGASTNQKDNAGWTPLHEAAIAGSEEATKLLIEHGADVNMPGLHNFTPLHSAVESYRGDGHKEVIKILLLNGADVNARTSKGFTVKDLTVKEEILQMLSEPVTPTVQVPKPAAILKTPLRSGRPVLFGIGLNFSQMQDLRKCVGSGKAKLTRVYGISVTHVVVPTSLCPTTYDALRALMQGKWIVSFEWISECMKQQKFVDEEPYECMGIYEYPSECTPRKARINREKQLPGLFDGCHIYIMNRGDFSLKKHEWHSIIEAGGGKALTREPDEDESDIPDVPYHVNPHSPLANCAKYIIFSDKDPPALQYRMPHLKSLPESWLLGCIIRFEIDI